MVGYSLKNDSSSPTANSHFTSIKLKPTSLVLAKSFSVMILVVGKSSQQSRSYSQVSTLTIFSSGCSAKDFSQSKCRHRLFFTDLLPMLFTSFYFFESNITGQNR